MKSFTRITAMLLFASSLQNCNNLPFDLEELENRLQDKHAFTISAIVRDDYQEPANQFLVSINGTSGNIKVNWGDNTSSSYVLNGNGINLEKIYSAPGRYQIIITGDLKNIVSFHSSYDQGVFDNINLKALTGLKSLRVGLTSGPEEFDLTNNKNLEELSLTDIDELTEIRMPKHHFISYASIAGPNNISSAVVNRVINSIYETAVRKEIYDGYFNVQELYFEDPEVVKTMIGPPSARAIEQLRELQDVYNWEIVPSPEPASKQTS